MRFSLILLLFAALFACKQQSGGELAEVAPPELPPHKISIDSLVRQAEGLGAIFGEATTKGRSVRAAGVVAMDDILFSKGATKSVGSSANTPKAYVVNYANDGGFAILADDRRLATNVLAYSESGNVDETTDNEGLLFYMSMADEYLAAEGRSLGLGDETLDKINYIPDRGSKPSNWGSTDGVPYHWPFRQTVEVSRKHKLVSTAWGQYYPYNLLAPVIRDTICPTGCAATAVVQLMSYHNNPSSITYFADGQTYSIDWGRAKQGDSIGIIEANIHYLMRDVGYFISTKYGTKGSSTGTGNVGDGLRHYGYTCSNVVTYGKNSVVTNIAKNRPVLVRGDEDSLEVGHIWVVDGYLETEFSWGDAIDYVVTDASDRPILVGQRIISQNYSPSNKFYLHVNWGWNGRNNGFFYDFDATDEYEFDGTLNPIEFSFNSNLKMITNIY